MIVNLFVLSLIVVILSSLVLLIRSESKGWDGVARYGDGETAKA